MSAHGLEAHIVVRRDGWELDVTLEAPAGLTTALLGPNGAGKSTIIGAIAGLTMLDRGYVRLGSRVLADADADVHLPAAARNVGVVFQDGLLFEHLSVHENVAFGPRSRGAAKGAAARQADDWLARLSIDHLRQRSVADLSGGEAQRVALARAMATGPELLLLDEPLGAIDVSGRAVLRRVIGDHLERFEGPRVLVTHDPTEAFLLADLVHVVEDGRVVQVGTPGELRLRPQTPYVADLVGINLLVGEAAGGVVDVRGHPVRVADVAASGPVLLTIHPHAIALYGERPTGSPRNTWETTVDRVEDLGDRVRVLLDAPLRLAAEVTPGSVETLDLRPGTPVWPAVKATEIRVTPDAGT
ncbi:MAG: ATP-binding cassette domain-containing protein [Nitriliruptorales bacterium]|nr:ATP-binding cassette domain-containing protein [Nitriliruptorales bacterium]